MEQQARMLVAASMIILLLAVVAAGFTFLVLDLVSAGRAYVAGESRWSQARQDAVFQLDRYAELGQAQYLEAARSALAVPLGDRQARLALEQPVANLQAAREGFLQGRNHPGDIPRMIRLFRHFPAVPYIRDAIRVWRESDALILELEHLAERIEREWMHGQPDRSAINAFRNDLLRIDGELRPMEIAFSESLGQGNRTFVRAVSALTIAGIFLVTLLSILLFRRAMHGIRRSEHKFWTTFEQAPVGMALINRSGSFIEVNDALCRILARGRAELLQLSLAGISHVEDRELPLELLAQSQESGTPARPIESRYVKPDRSILWGKLTISRILAEEQRPDRCIAVIEDISEARRLSEELAYQASHDHLTGLPNRREFERHLDQVLHYSRAHGTRHALCLIDLDQFKVVNDTIGHAAGDSLLVRASEQMQRRLRPSDILARLGGDEFGVILIDCNLETATRVAERLRNAIADFKFYWEDRVVVVSGSVGLVELSPDTRDSSAALQAADVACYLAKDQGRNQVHVHSEENLASVRRQDEMAWVNRLNEAIASDGLRFHAQILIPLGLRGSLRCELLVRMLGKDGKLFPAGSFIEAAERFNVARTLDRWVVRNSLIRIEELQPRLPEITSWHINLSGQSIDCEQMLPEIVQAISEHSIPPQRLCFEITESAAMYSLSEAERFFEALRDLGCQVALDDFGKGLSSFSYLKRLPVDFVKIDGSFVRELIHNELDDAMVRSIHKIAHIAGKRTIAECVESVEVQLKLTQLGIDFAQGYAIHTPCPLEELTTTRPRRRLRAQA